ncbi:substrate-binding periplasmic protein [Rugamonas sp. CCM 8940]|uniref:substrate-binding periplasmic protein n=1 Tax=Rugamonas sp. CCM 8940 TaxID=2765359 RepID=UPI0018F31C97|nr:transporter substrate-binding domain-containing protein [Rugamonas sp. CCM 8940]MBJ7311649.1 transporter substrate-binding domain-containing protein [Rugamonas sp. CCM 8940]
MNKPVMLLLAVLGAGMAPAAGAAAEPVTALRVMAQESLPPKWMTRHGRASGICPDILAAIERLAPQLRFSGQDDYRSVPVIERSLESGEVDCACALMDTAKRRRIANPVGKPLYMIRHKLAAAAGDKAEVNNFDDLLKLKPIITTSRGAGYSVQLRALGLEVDDSTGDNLVNLKKIVAGHGRFFYMNEVTLSWIVRQQGLRDQVRILPAVLKEEPIYFWISKQTDPAARRQVELALGKLQASGELARIYEHWVKQR